MIDCVFFGNLYLKNRVPYDFFEFVKDRYKLDIFGDTSGIAIPNHIKSYQRVPYAIMRNKIKKYDFCISLGNLCDLQIPSKIADLDNMGIKTLHICYTDNDPILELPKLENFIYINNVDLLLRPEFVMQKIKNLVSSKNKTKPCHLLSKQYVVDQYVRGMTGLLE